jgi:uncharacterized protein YjiS (DUF1127 family)
MPDRRIDRTINQVSGKMESLMVAEGSQPRARRWVGRAVASLAQLPGRIWLTIEGWGERHRLRRELAELRQRGELGRTLADSGLSTSDVSRLLRAHPHTRQQLAEMMRRQGIDRGALQRSTLVAEALRAMEWRCGECADWRQCNAWLASRDNAPQSHRAFCPNAEAFDALRRSEAAASETSS